MHSLRAIANREMAHALFDTQSQDFQPMCERCIIDQYLIFMIKEQTTAGPGSLRNEDATYLLNCHNTLYSSSEYRICNGPYRLIAIDLNSNTLLDDNGLDILAQVISDRMTQDIQAGRYFFGITIAEGIAIKRHEY
jgi:hypothetical protein